MKKLISWLFIGFLTVGFSSSALCAERDYAVTGVVSSVDREFATISVDDKSYRLAKDVSVHDMRLREVPPTIKDIRAGDNVGLVFVGSSKKSRVKEVWFTDRVWR